MTQEEKQLLLKDLCARLPYGVKCGILTSPEFRSVHWKEKNDLYWMVDEPRYSVLDYDILKVNHIDCIKPYLRPMSSMTKEEEREVIILWNEDFASKESLYHCYNRTTDYYNAHHFDYRGLIEKGLALEAPEGMYK